MGHELHEMSKPTHDHDHGLAHDLHLLTRRRLLWFLGGAALVPVIASCTQIDSSDVGADAGSEGLGLGLGLGLEWRWNVLDDSAGDGRALPRRRHERRERADADRHRSQRHHAEPDLDEGRRRLPSPSR